MVLAHPHLHRFHQDILGGYKCCRRFTSSRFDQCQIFQYLTIAKTSIIQGFTAWSYELSIQSFALSMALWCTLIPLSHSKLQGWQGQHLELNYCWPSWMIWVTVVWRWFAVCWHSRITKLCARQGGLQFSLWGKFGTKITSAGVVAPTISSIVSKDSSISQFACESLVNLSKWVAPYISAMRSQEILCTHKHHW